MTQASSFRFASRAVARHAMLNQAIADQAMTDIIDEIPDLARRQIIAVRWHQCAAKSNCAVDIPLRQYLLLIIRSQVKWTYQEFRPDQAVAGTRLAMTGRTEYLKEFPPMADRLRCRRNWVDQLHGAVAIMHMDQGLGARHGYRTLRKWPDGIGAVLGLDTDLIGHVPAPGPGTRHRGEQRDAGKRERARFPPQHTSIASHLCTFRNFERVVPGKNFPDPGDRGGIRLDNNPDLVDRDGRVVQTVSLVMNRPDHITGDGREKHPRQDEQLVRNDHVGGDRNNGEPAPRLPQKVCLCR